MNLGTEILSSTEVLAPKIRSWSLIVSHSPFIKLSKAHLATQALSEASELVFSHFSAIEGNRRQALLTARLDKIEIVRTLIANELSTAPRTHTGVLHCEVSAFVNLL